MHMYQKSRVPRLLRTICTKSKHKSRTKRKTVTYIRMCRGQVQSLQSMVVPDADQSLVVRGAEIWCHLHICLNLSYCILKAGYAESYRSLIANVFLCF